MRKIAITVVFFSLCGGCLAGKQPQESRQVTRGEIRGHIDAYVCAAWLDDISAYEARFGDPSCAPPNPSKVGAAIAAGLTDAAIVVPLAADAYERAYAELDVPDGRSNDELDAVLRAVYWSDPHLGPAAEARVLYHLSLAGLRCTDCVSFMPEPHTLEWMQFSVYVLAYLWPDRATDAEETHLHVCSASNGAAALGLSQPTLLEAGFLAAAAIAEAPELRDPIVAILATNPPPDAARVEIARLLDTGLARNIACERVSSTSWFTGVRILGCGSS